MAEKRNIILFGAIIILTLSYWVSSAFFIGDKPFEIKLLEQEETELNENLISAQGGYFGISIGLFCNPVGLFRRGDLNAKNHFHLLYRIFYFILYFKNILLFLNRIRLLRMLVYLS